MARGHALFVLAVLGCSQPHPASLEAAPTAAPPPATVPVPDSAVIAGDAAAPLASVSRPAPPIHAGGLAMGYELGCALEAQRSCVACWGLNGASGGRTGPPPSRVPTTGEVRSVSTGAAFGCARTGDGHVACWGSDDRGQLGDGAHDPRAAPVAVTGLDHVVELAAGSRHACALRDDGHVWCWGSDETGQLGDGRKGVGMQGKPAPMLGVDDAVHVAAGSETTCVVRRSGRVACVGQGVARATPVADVADAEELALGGYFGCARVHDGTLRCWGNNAEGQLGRRTPVSSATALPVVALSGVVRVAAAGATACAIEHDGGVWCWGDDATGFLGTQSRVDCVPTGPSGTACGSGASYRAEPTAIAWMKGAVDVALTATDGCARFGDGGVRCWGRNARRAPGDPPQVVLPLAGACP